MNWQQIAVIWVLCVTLGGLASLGVWLWHTRDGARRGQRRKPSREQRADTIARWQRNMDAARERAEARARAAALRYGQRVTEASARWAGPPCAEALRRLPASLTESRERVCDARKLWEMVAAQPADDPWPERAGQPDAAAALHAWYAAREAEQLIDLLDAGMVRWPS